MHRRGAFREVLIFSLLIFPPAFPPLYSPASIATTTIQDFTRESCENDFTPDGGACRWLASNKWDSNVLTPVAYARCSDPSFKTKESCLEAGVCRGDVTKTTSAFMHHLVSYNN